MNNHSSHGGSHNSSHGHNSSYGSHGYQSSPLNADKMHSPTHGEYIKVGKDPHQHWKDTVGNSSASNHSFFKDFMMQWPVQLLERQIQFIASSKVDFVGDTSSLITDIDFRWLGIRNLRTIFISTLSFMFGIIAFVLIALFTKNMLLSYVAFFAILSHSLFAGYITFRMRKFILGDAKSKRFADIVRSSWASFEVIFCFVSFGIYFTAENINWVVAKKVILDFLETKIVLKKLLFQIMSKLPIDKLDFILGHLLNALLIVSIFYIFMVFITNKNAKKERTRLQRAVDKEYLRPAQIVKKIANEGRD